jgi:hypothetical protein
MPTIQIVTTFAAYGDDRDRFLGHVRRVFGNAGLIVADDERAIHTKTLPIRERDGRADPEMMHAYVTFSVEKPAPGNEERVAFAKDILEKLTTYNADLKAGSAGEMRRIYYNAKSYWKIRLLEDRERPARSVLPKFE